MNSKQILEITEGLVVIRVSAGEGMAELPLQRDAHTSGQIKSGAQLNEVYAEVSTPELSTLGPLISAQTLLKCLWFLARAQPAVSIKTCLDASQPQRRRNLGIIVA